MKKTPRQHLRLSRETLRNLANMDASMAVGGEPEKQQGVGSDAGVTCASGTQPTITSGGGGH